MARRPSRLLILGYYVQMFAAFLLIALTHYFTAAFLPIADCDETYNFVEPAHYVLYGTGKQTWENCPQFALRSWLFVWIYAWPAALIKGASSLSSVDVYYYLRLFNGRLVGLAELYCVYSVWAAFSGKAAMVTLLILLLNYPIPHAAVSVLPTSFVMACYFVALGSWMRTVIPCHGSAHAASAAVPPRTTSEASSLFYPSTISARSQRVAVASTVFFVVLAGLLGWPFAGLVAVPIGLDLLIRFPWTSIVCLIVSLVLVGGASIAVDTFYYCRPVLVAWNIVKYNVFGGADRGPELYGTEPWFYFFKNLLLNFHIVFVAALLAPAVVLLRKRRSSAASPKRGGSGSAGLVASSRGRGRQLLFVSPFFLWFTFWLLVAHKEERFMAPAYPFMVCAATLTITYLFFPDPDTTGHRSAGQPDRHASRSPVGESLQHGRRPPTTSSPTPTTTKHSSKAARRPSSRRRLGVLCGMSLLLVFGVLSFSRALAVYHFYSAPERALYDWYLAVQQEATAKLEQTGQRYQVCVGKEWYRFPSSFFLDSRVADYQFLKVRSFSGMLPVPFPTTSDTAAHWAVGLLQSADADTTRAPHTTEAGLGTCQCGAADMNDLNRAIPAQYTDVAQCDAVFDSIASEEEAREIALDQFPHSIFANDRLRALALRGTISEGRHVAPFYHPRSEESYRLLDVDHTPMWCRVLYYPFGLSDRCARWRMVVFQARQLYTIATSEPPSSS